MSTTHPPDAVARYWGSVQSAAASGDPKRKARAQELLRLLAKTQSFRELFPVELPQLTIDTATLGGHASGSVDPLGGWGQGVAITLRAARVDPFNTTGADLGLEPAAMDRSLIFGHSLLANRAGETIRQLEADLLLLAMLARALQHIEAEKHPTSGAVADLRSYGGCGDWLVRLANSVWRGWCDQHCFPFVPCRHSRRASQAARPSLSEDLPEDQPWSADRPSVARWPHACLFVSREPAPEGDRPEKVPPEVWSRWGQEQQRLRSALLAMLGGETIAAGIKWPAGQAPELTEEGRAVITPFPSIPVPVPTFVKVRLPFEPELVVQTVRAAMEQRDPSGELWRQVLAAFAACQEDPAALAEEPTEPDPFRLEPEEPPAEEQLEEPPAQVDEVEAAVGQAVEQLGDLLEQIQHELEEQVAEPPARVEAPVEELRLEPEEPAQPSLRKAPTPLDAEVETALSEEVDALCRRHGNDWPRGVAAQLGRRFGLHRQRVHERKREALERLGRQQEVA